MTALALGAVMLVCGAARPARPDAVARIQPESMELVNVIKEDLRRNNDDYAEAIARNNTPATSNQTAIRKPFIDLDMDTLDIQNHYYYKQRWKDADHIRRRAYVPEVSNNRSTHRTQHQYPPTAAGPRLAPKQRFSARSHSAASTFGGILKFRSFTSQYPKKFAAKPDKLKRFIQKNRGKIQEMKKRAQAVKVRVTSEVPASPGPQIPSPEQLDMAPAKGGRVHALRIKGRLCQRHVMIPEGPKYDSKGQVYLPAHEQARARGRQYADTAAPRMLLPRCCNCCRKSVLGCE